MSYCNGLCEHLNEQKHKCELTGEKLSYIKGWWGITHEHRGFLECDKEETEGGTKQDCSECRMCNQKEEQASTETNKKAILVIDMPKSCEECLMLNGADECILQDEDTNFLADTLSDLMAECPLKEIPDKKEVCGKYPQEDGIVPSYKIGWNDCIDKILRD